MMQKVKAVIDGDGHWYLVPNELIHKFCNDLDNSEMCDSGEFDNIYGEYRTGGDLNLIQLYVALIKDTEVNQEGEDEINKLAWEFWEDQNKDHPKGISPDAYVLGFKAAYKLKFKIERRK